MSGSVWLATRYATRNAVQTWLLAMCLAVTVAIPVCSRLLVSRFDDRMTEQSDSVPLVVGARGSRFDLVLASVFLREPTERSVPMGVWRELSEAGRVEAIPMQASHTVRGRRLVCVGHGYFDRLGLSVSEGTLPLLVGDVVVGSRLADELGVSVGDRVESDRRELFDLSVPEPVSLLVVGVLGRSDGPADNVFFASIETAWLVGGQTHSHVTSDEAAAEDVLGQSESAVTLKPTVGTSGEVSGGNLLSFHAHEDPDALPLTAVLVFADDAKPLTLTSARFDADDVYQAVRPADSVDELLRTVVRVRRVFDAIAGVLGAATIALFVLTFSLAARLRREEFEILSCVGAPRGFRAALLALQVVLVSVLAAGIAVVLVGAVVSIGSAMGVA